MTSPSANQSTPEEVRLQAERDELRTALAAARGTILDLRSHLADLGAAQSFLRLSRDAAISEARELRDQFTAAHTELNAIIAERNWLPGVRDMHAARLRALEPMVQEIAMVTEERNTLAQRAEVLDRLARTLRWDNGPRSLQAVLPIARLIRRMRGG